MNRERLQQYSKFQGDVNYRHERLFQVFLMGRENLLEDPSRLTGRIQEVLQERSIGERLFPRGVSKSMGASAVLFPLSGKCSDSRFVDDPCLVLNKRSQLIKQAGDLCFPGGAIAHRLDPKLAWAMRLPFFPLSRWPYWPEWQRERPRQARRLSLLFATSIRESLEEMRLNPLDVKFLGPLPPHRLEMFPRDVFPFVGWIRNQRRFFTNREVEKIVRIPLRELLNRDHYARYRLLFNASNGPMKNGESRLFPCFLHQTMMGTEILWGVTYRIAMAFLDLIFGFKPPDMDRLQVVQGEIYDRYYRNGY